MPQKFLSESQYRLPQFIHMGLICPLTLYWTWTGITYSAFDFQCGIQWCLNVPLSLSAWCCSHVLIFVKVSFTFQVLKSSNPCGAPPVKNYERGHLNRKRNLASFQKRKEDKEQWWHGVNTWNQIMIQKAALSMWPSCGSVLSWVTLSRKAYAHKAKSGS